MSFTQKNSFSVMYLVNNDEFTKYMVKNSNTKERTPAGFVEIREKIMLTDIDCIRIRLCDANVYDIISTLAMFMATENYCTFTKWKVRNDYLGFSITMPIHDYVRIQRGYTTELMIMKTHNMLCYYNDNPKFPWIVRCLVDTDDIIFGKGVRCLYYLLTSALNFPDVNSYFDISRWRMLPHLLTHLKTWRTEFDKSENFLKGILTFLTPFSEKIKKQTFFISEEASDIMLKYDNCPLKVEKAERQTIKYTKKDEFFLHEFYKWLMKIDSAEAVKIFCGVHNDVDLVKAKSKKRKANSRKEYFEQSIQVHYNSVTVQGKIEPITQKKKRLADNLLDLVYYVCTKFRDDAKNDNVYSICQTMIQRGVIGKYTPIASLPHKTDTEHRFKRQNDIFPIVKLTKSVEKKLKELKVNFNNIINY